MKRFLETIGYLDTFDAGNFHAICNELAKRDQDLGRILEVYGYPPFWTRENTFETLVHIVLEQQVSLASALAALKMLRAKTIFITPESILGLSDAEMRACYVSRQKTGYIRGLAEAIHRQEISLEKLTNMSDAEVRAHLIPLKGIGNWTIDVYLMFVIHRTDIFPIGDLAAVNALKRVKNLSPATSPDDILKIAQGWQPYRTVATMLLWHFYLSTTGKAIIKKVTL